MPTETSIFQKAVSRLSSGISNTLFDKQKKAIAISREELSRGVAPYSDPKKLGVKKPSKVTFEQLRMVAASDTIIRICVNTIKKAVSQAPWDIVPRKRYKDDYNREHITRVNDLFDMVNTNGENLRTLFDMILEDLLVLDAGVLEKVHNMNGELVELNSVDAATIRPVVNKYGEVGGYVQVIDNKVVAKFEPNEIIYMMQNPQNDIKLFGYGRSPIEEILLTVQASLNADVYNAKIFSNDNIPPGLLDLGNMSTAEANNFIALWNATVVSNTQKLKFVWGSDNSKKYIPFQQANKDMQYMEYIDWLSRLKLATYGLTAIDANITQDVNKATAEVQESITSTRGVSNIFTLMEEYINREIIIPMGFNDVGFRFNRESTVKAKKLQAEIDKIYIETGVISPIDVAKREGLDLYTTPDEEIELELDGGVSPNPADEEIELKEDTDDTESKSKNYYKPIYK